MVENATANINALCNTRTNVASCSSESIFRFLYASSSHHSTSEQFVSCTPVSTLLFIHPHKQKPNLARTVDSNIYLSVSTQNQTHVHVNLFLSQWTILSPQKRLIFHSESSCICQITWRLILKRVFLTHCGRVTQICVFNTVKLGTSASSP